MIEVLKKKKALLLDMNSTFMFNEDRFGENEDFYLDYEKRAGILSPPEVNRIIRAAYNYLNLKYTNKKYRESFPSVESAIREVISSGVDDLEVERLVETFTFHELGRIPCEFAEVLHSLSRHFVLAAVIDIWAPKQAWLREFERAGVLDVFSALSFSSDHGKVKPSPKAFELVLNQLSIEKSDALYVGDSITRDLEGSLIAGIECILVGGARHINAIASYRNLIELYEQTVENRMR
jgi:FMN phosphatase YigB (HAD superfamily)